jgi:hypothetical protein
MSRSGYSDDCDQWALIRWRGAVTSAIRGKRGQAFLKEMSDALDAIPGKRLINGDLEVRGEVCAIGAVGVQRGIDMAGIDPEDRQAVSNAFGIPDALAAEIMYENDEGGGYWRDETPEGRWQRVREWVAGKIVEPEHRSEEP